MTSCRASSEYRHTPVFRHILGELNDPWGEHDFGSFEHNGNTIFWKIDCYDREMKHGSPNPADATVTQRVLTVLLAEEY